ncbi:MAG TPA: serine/threonine-protein kinase [Kofleriaceae bacterium]
MREDDAATTLDAPSDEQETAAEYPASVKSKRIQAQTPSDEDDDEPLPLEIGSEIGRYVIERILGKGGMGVVFEAYDRELQRKVAIKLLSPRTPVGSPLWQERLLREARAMARVSHPNVVPIYDIGELGHQVFIAMELVEGLTLREWLSARTPAWREIVDVFRQVGRGLAAAHEAGLVHRDVKPDNILIGNDGRARLTDFGVVKEVGDASVERTDPSIDGTEPSERRSRPSHSLGPELTRYGMLIGTIAYMAPEQLDGQVADPRTDQFSFCATFYRGLYGVNPCSKRDPKRLAEWRPPDPPEGTKVPPWVRRVLVRGLSPDPSTRYPSMDALLGELQEPRRIPLIPVIATGAVIAVAIPLLLIRDDQRTCPDEKAKLAGVWDDSTKRTIHDAFLATKKPYAEASFRSVERTLDAYVAGWLEMQAASCELRDRNDARRDCLELRLEDLRAQTELFAKADPRTVELAVAAASSLIDPNECAHTSAASTTGGAPGRGLRKQLSVAKALEDLGKLPEGIAIVQAVVAQARAIPDRAIEAEALYQLGELQRRSGDMNAAATLEQAIVAAVATRHDDVAARAWIRMATVVGIEKGQYEDGLRLSQHGRAFIDRLGGDKRLEAMLAGDLSIIYRRLGRYDESLRHIDRALELGEKIYGPQHTQVGSWLNSSGLTLLEAGNHAEARKRFQRALAIFSKEFGPHPKVATAYGNLGLERFRSHDYEQAVAFAQRALEIDELESGPKSAKLLSTLNLIGSAYSQLGKHDDGIAALRRAVSLAETLPPQNHKRLAANVSLGIAYNRAKRFAEALPLLEPSLATLEHGSASADPSDLGETRFGLAQALHGLGDTQRARSLAIRAREELAASADKNKSQLAEVDSWIAQHSSP